MSHTANMSAHRRKLHARELHEKMWSRAEKMVRNEFRYSWREVTITQVGTRGFYFKRTSDVVPQFKAWLA